MVAYTNKNADIIVITCICPFCGQEEEVPVYAEDYADWENGKLIQDAFPYLSANQRELLISGICPKCWDRMFEGE